MTAISLIVSAFFIYNYLDRTINSFKHDVIKSFETSLDKIITYDSISPSILQYLEIRKLFITDSNGNCLIKAEKLRISFSLYKYFFTDDFPIGSVYFENSSLSYNHNNDSGTVKAVIKSLENSRGKKRDVRELRIEGKNISLITDLPSGRYNMQKLFLDISFSSDSIALDMRSKISGDKIPFLKNNSSLKTDIRMRGNSSTDLSWNNYDIELINLRTDDFLIRKQNFNIDHSGNNIKLLKTRARDPFDLFAEYDIDKKLLSVNTKSENYRPSKYIHYYSSNTFSGMLKSVYSGTAVLFFSFKDRNIDSLSYKADLSVSFDKSIVPFENNIRTVFHGNTKQVIFTDFNADTDRGDIRYRGYYDIRKKLPEGRLSLRNINAGENLLVNSDISIGIEGEDSLFLSADAEAGKLNLENIECHLSRKGKNLIYKISYIDINTGFIRAEGSLSHKKSEMMLKSDIELNRINIKRFSYVYSNSDSIRKIVPENLFLSTKFYFETDFRNINLFTETLTLEDESGKNRISSDFSVFDNNFVFHNIVIDWKDYNGKGYISLNNSDDNSYQIKSSISLNNESYSFSGSYINGRTLSITGSSDLSLLIFFERDRTVYYLNTDRFPFPVQSTVPEFSLNIKGEAGKGRIIFFIENNRIYNLPLLKGKESFIAITSSVTDSKIMLHNFTVKDNFSTVRGSGELNYPDKNNISGWIKGNSAEKNEQHLILFDYSDSIYDVTAEFTNFPSERITDKPLSGDLSGIMRIKGPGSNPVYSVEMNMDNGLFLDDPFAFNFSLNASNESLILNTLKVKHNLNRIDSASGYINKDEGSYFFSGNLFLRKGVSDKETLNKIELEGEIFEKTFKWFSNPLLIENKGIIRVSNNESTRNDFSKWELSFINNESFLIFNGGPANSIEGEINRNGLFNVILSKPLPISGKFNGVIKDGIIDSICENIEIDLKTFGAVTDIAYFKADSGKASGNLVIKGPVNDPDFQGHLNVSGVKASSVFVPADIIMPNTSFIFNGKSLSMPETGLIVEENTLKAKLDFSIDHWLPKDFDIDIKTDPGRMLWIKHKFSMIDIDGFASGNVSIEGDEQGLYLSGNIAARKCIITLNDDKKNGKKKKKGSFDYEVDLKVTSGPGVEFYWPSVRLPVLRTFAAAGEKLSIYSNSATDEYSLTGDIKIQGGEVFYFSQSFFIKEGSIVFNENETKFDPHFTARAELRERTSENKEVKISLIADDTPLSQFSPRFESNPPLSENEIFALLGESVYTQFGGEDITFGSALLGAGAYSTQLIGIFRPFETRMKNMLNLDLFTIRTNVLQQAFDNDKKENITISENNTPVDNSYLDNTTIFMGKYFGEYFFLEGLVSFNSRDFDIYQYNDYDVPDFMGMHIKTELSLEVDTPLFLMDLTLYPQLTDFYNSLTDTSLEFSWRFSY